MKTNVNTEFMKKQKHALIISCLKSDKNRLFSIYLFLFLFLDGRTH